MINLICQVSHDTIKYNIDKLTKKVNQKEGYDGYGVSYQTPAS
jgi:hypothetical protein